MLIFLVCNMVNSRHPNKGLGFLLADVSRLLRRDFDRRVRELGMTQAQWRALAHLARDEGINQAALAERLEVAPITLARLIDRMEQAGWVRRAADSADRRATLLFLTPRARPILRELETHADAALEMLLQGMPAATRRQLMQSLEQMKTNLIESDAAVDAAR
jgi:DNA-binding MarR family transcriptional regulator